MSSTSIYAHQANIGTSLSNDNMSIKNHPILTTVSMDKQSNHNQNVMSQSSISKILEGGEATVVPDNVRNTINSQLSLMSQGDLRKPASQIRVEDQQSIVHSFDHQNG